MPPIDNKTVNSPGYFHHVDDTSKTRTALRATFDPSPNNKITNYLARSNMPASAGMVNAVRDCGLLIHKSWNQRRLTSARAKLGQMTSADKEPLDADLQKQKQRIEQREHKALRLHGKQVIGTRATEGLLDKTVIEFNETLQTHLEKKDYIPLSDLSNVKLEAVTSRYLHEVTDNHRIKVHPDGPPRLAKFIAPQVSAAYERGSSGIASRSRSTLQHALVGIQGAALSVKGTIAGRLANSQYLDAGGSARMEERKVRSKQDRTMLKASLGGNEELNQAYRDVVDEQVKSARGRFAPSDDPDAPQYVVRASNHGIKPPQTRSWERRLSNFYRPPGDDANPTRLEPQLTGASSVSSNASSNDSSEIEPGVQRKPGRMARFAVAASNLRNKRDLRKAGGDVAVAAVKLSGLNSEERDNAYGQKLDQASTAYNKAGHNYATRRSVLQGKLIETLEQPGIREMLDESFPVQDRVHEDLPWQPRTRPRDDE